jgi:hypothetical protein
MKEMIDICGKPFEQRFYYVRDDERKPVVTVCVLNTPDFSEVVRGISICSYYDQVDKKDSKKEASKRARLAFHKKNSSLPVKRDEALNNLEDASLIEYSDGPYGFQPKATDPLGDSILTHGKSAYLTGDVEDGLTEAEKVLIRMIPPKEKDK